MSVFVFITALICIISGSSLLNFLAPPIDFLNSICLSLIPNSPHSELPKSLLCGANISAVPLKSALKSTSLIHLVVISGAHLIALENILCSIKKLDRYNRLILIPLSFYVLFSGANPPAVRSWFAIFLRSQNFFYKMNWPPITISWISGISTLLIQPSWYLSLSLTLSWSASFSVSICQQYYPKSSLFKKQVFIYFIMILPLIPLGLPHSVTILINLLVAPILSHTLLPLSFLYTIFPQNIAFILKWLSSQIINLSQQVPPPLISSTFSCKHLLIYPILLHLIFLFIQRNKGRQKFLQV